MKFKNKNVLEVSNKDLVKARSPSVEIVDGEGDDRHSREMFELRFEDFDAFDYFVEKLKKERDHILILSRGEKTIRKKLGSMRLKVLELNKEINKVKVRQ